MKKALITGITGQDGSYLAELLLKKGYKVYGFVRHESWVKPNNASHLSGQIEIITGNMAEGTDIALAIQESQPDEIYNLASQSRPAESWARAPETLLVNGMGAIRLFEAVRHHFPECRVYHASSSEMFGQALSSPQSENTPFHPVNPYAAAKIYAHNMAHIYRDSYKIYIACGILFNHESERRPLHFLTQKVAYGAACAALGITTSPDLNEAGRPIVNGGKLSLGNLEIARDWGYAGDFVKAMWLMLQQEQPRDYVIGTGKLHTLKYLCESAYNYVNLDWRQYITTDVALMRPLESGQTLADPSKARKELGWEPSVDFDEMIHKMVEAQIVRLKSNSSILMKKEM
jgi:GDPmannose 4,6-dehydratase